LIGSIWRRERVNTEGSEEIDGILTGEGLFGLRVGE